MTSGGAGCAAGSALRRIPVWVVMLLAMHGAHAYQPQANYILNCMGCHAEDGSGAPGKVPALRNTLVPFAQSAAGRRYLVQVPGTSQSALSDAEIAQLLNWMMRHLCSQTPPAAVRAFTAAEVSSYRSQRLEDPAATRKRLLSADSTVHR